jgi:hypothetical protein
MEGKVYGVKNGKNQSNMSRKDVKNDCIICEVAKTCLKRIEELSDPNNNPKLTPVDGYEGKIFIHDNSDMNDLSQNIEEAKHIIDAGFDHIKHIIINPHIIEKWLPNQEYTFFYKDGRKLYGDRKGVQGESGITSSFSRAVNDQCDKVLLIEFDTQFKQNRLRLDNIAKNLYFRLNDFTEGRIFECYIARDGYVVRFDKEFLTSGTKEEVKKRIIKLLEPMRTKKEG